MDAAGQSTVRVAALNNLETIYSEAVSYIDAITHASSYYTDAQAAAKFFTSATDGTGTGLICATLDGYTAQQIIDSSTPAGCIGIWSGSEASIPSGWYLCDGTNATPNLRDRFVLVAGGSFTAGQTGGGNTATPSSSALSIGTHAINGAELPEHTHGYVDYYDTNSTGTAWGGYGANSDTGRWTIAGTSTAHGHAATFTGTTTDIRPAYMALCFIMKA